MCKLALRLRHLLAFYVHCNAHCLNLVLVDCVKSISEASCFFSLLQRLYVFVSGSHVHQRWLEIQKEMYQGPPRELQRLIETRWACRYKACKVVQDRLPAITRLLKELSLEGGGDRCVDARGLLAQIDEKFVTLLVTYTHMFGEVYYLSESLQSTKLNLGTAVSLVDALVDTLQSFKVNGALFDEMWEEAMSLKEQCSVSVSTPVREVTQSTKLNDYIFTPITHRGHGTDKESFRSGSFIPVIEVLLSEVNRRFSKETCAIMYGIQALNPSSPTFCVEECVFPFAVQYNCNTDDLKSEMRQLKRIIERKKSKGEKTPSSLLELTVNLEPYSEVFDEFYKLCKIALALPVSTASCERSFSVLKLIKTHLRTRMSDERLGNLGVLSVESRRAKAINLDTFVDLFARRHNNRWIKLI